MANPNELIYLGEIRMFGGTSAPAGWAFCNGALQQISDNPTLFSLLGTTYGGDGFSTFGLPDLQGRLPIHTDSEKYPVGRSAGAEQVSLVVDNLPSHTHNVASATSGKLDNPKGNLWGTAAQNVYAGGAGNIAMSVNCTATVGKGVPHDNMVPFICINYIIALAGVYPSHE